MVAPALLSRTRDDWGTPPAVFAPLHHEFHFALDVAAEAANTLCPFWLGPGGIAEDALQTSWDLGPCWMNPPYSRGREFVAKAVLEMRLGVTTVALLPARTDTRMFHDYIWDRRLHRPKEGVEVRFVKGRITFVGALHGAPFPSMIVVLHGITPPPSPNGKGAK